MEAHATHNNWYSSWNKAKDLDSELNYPCVLWDQWNGRLQYDEMEFLHRVQLVRLLIATTVATDRTPEQRDVAVEAADKAATDIVLKLIDLLEPDQIGNVQITTQFDEYTQLLTGVLLSFTIKGDALCLDDEDFNPTECQTFEELILAESWATIKPAMTVEQLADATADLGGGPCAPLGYDLHNSEDTILLSGVVTDPCGGTLELTAPDATYDLKDADGNTLSSGSIPSQVNAVVTAPSATVLRDGSPYGNVLSGGSIDVESDCPTPLNSTVQLKDSVGVDIGAPIAVPYNSTNYPVTAPDGTVTIKNFGGTTLGTQAVKSNGAIDYVAPIPLKFGWAAGDGDTLTWTVTADEAGTYGTYTPTGTNGTITYSKNGGGYAALSGSITLAVSDTITVRRTTTTSEGSVKWGA